MKNKETQIVKIKEMINTEFSTATTLDKTKIDEGWTDSGKTITFSEALYYLVEE